MKRHPSAARTLPFSVEIDDLLEYRVRRDWRAGYARSVLPRHLIVADAESGARHTVPKTSGRLREVHGARLVELQQQLTDRRALPALFSGAVPVRATVGGTPRAVPKRRGRYRSEAYLGHVRSLPPLDGGQGGVEAHHVNEAALGGDRGVGQVSDDYQCVPLTERAHARLTRTRRLPGQSRAQTERTLLRGLVSTLTAWIVKNETTEEQDEAEARYLDALSGRGLRRLVGALALVLLLLPAACLAGEEPPAPPPRRPAALILGEEALRFDWPITAYRRCLEAAAPRGPHRAAALLCQGRAALRLGWAAEALGLARAALREQHYPAGAYVLLGDALRREKGGCPAEARTAYLDALAALPGDAQVIAGLRACTVESVAKAAPAGAR